MKKEFVNKQSKGGKKDIAFVLIASDENDS